MHSLAEKREWAGSAAGLSCVLALALSAALVLITLTAPPASAYSNPQDVPDPFQEYSAQDYADALWNLETTTWSRTFDRETRGDCDVITYEVSHPLGLEPAQTYVHISDSEDWWCDGSDGDELREELNAQDEEDENFHHGIPYENTSQRVPYYGTWADVNGNGHNSRTEIHARDLGNSTFTVSGTYWDHYSGQMVDIGQTETHGEHIIPVGHTWPEMQHRSREDRVAYYNDHMNLTSTIGWINREKSGHTPYEWMPSNEGAHCRYAMTWTHISNKHEVSLFQRDIDHLRELLWDCLAEELPEDAETMTGERSPDLEWQEPAPAAGEGIEEGDGEGPHDPFSGLDLADAVWNLENHVPVRSVERETHEDCDVQTHTATHPRSGEETVYLRAISADNTSCEGDEAEELREELEAQAEEEEGTFHGSPLDGQSRRHFGYWTVPEEGDLNTRHQVLARDLDGVEWNSSQTGVTGGSFTDPYTGEGTEYAGPETAVDHIIPVQHSWVEMEHRDDAERTAYYNDLRNLVAVPEESRQDRGAQAPRDWMPEEEFRCAYSVAWVHTAAEYEISLFSSDIAELRRTLYTCLEERSEDGELEASRRSELEWVSLSPQ